MDATDFLAEAVMDDRAFRHGLDFGQIVFLGAESVDDGDENETIESSDEGIPSRASEKLEERVKPPCEKIEEVKWPKDQ